MATIFFVAASVEFALSSGRAPSSAHKFASVGWRRFFRRSTGRVCVEIGSSSEHSTNLQVLAWRRFFSSQHRSSLVEIRSSKQILVWRLFFSSQHRSSSSSSGQARSSTQICKCWRGDDFFVAAPVGSGQARSSAQFARRGDEAPVELSSKHKLWRGDDFSSQHRLSSSRARVLTSRSLGVATIFLVEHRSSSANVQAFPKLKSSFGLMHAIRTAAHFPGTVSARACSAAPPGPSVAYCSRLDCVSVHRAAPHTTDRHMGRLR